MTPEMRGLRPSWSEGEEKKPFSVSLNSETEREALAAASICHAFLRHLAMRPKLVLVAYSSRQASSWLT